MRKALQLLVAFLLMIVLVPQVAYAQEKTISGTVLSDDKTPLPGVTIRVKGTRRITQTDANGKFTLQVSPGETLQITYVGYEPQEVKAGDGATLGITLKASEGALGEVVVTAMDIKRNKRELGYSTQTVGGDDIRETQRENFINSLQGRVAGLTINPTSGTAGSSSAIVLRGFNSLSLSNQPLFVMDGVIMDNTSLDENSQGGSGVGIVERGAGLTSTNNQKTDYTNRMADINPNDIESITVLKGPEATALYGSQASSGAIVITTRRPKSSKFALQYDNSLRFSKVTRYPETIDGYRNGENGVASDVFRYFGPAYEPGTKLYNNKDAFFKTSFTHNHNLGMDFGFKKSLFRFTASYFDQDGVVPNNTYKKINFRLSNTTKVGKWLEITPAISYIRAENRKVLRSAGGFLIGLMMWPNTIDIRNYEAADGSKIPLFNSNPNADYDNPLFNVNKNKNYDENDRYGATLGININPTSWLSFSGRFGYDAYDAEGYLQYHPQSYYIAASVNGIQDNWWRKYTGYNHTITGTARKSLGKFSGRLMVGTMWQDYQTQMFAVSGNNLSDPNRTDSANTAPNTRTYLLRNVYGEYNQFITKMFAYFGEAAVSYDNKVFLNYTHRFEEASTLPKQNRKYNYPGASLSLIMTDIIPGLKRGGIDYVKLRGSLAGTARLNLPYSTQSVFTNVTSSGGGFQYGFTNNNPDLEPERQKTFEIGTEWRFFKGRLSVDAAYYNTLTRGQIIEGFRLSYGTGYVLNTQNAGSTRNEGVEVTISANIVRKTDWNWDMQFNFNRMWSRVTEMPANVAEYYIADTWVFGNARGGIIKGGPTTTITAAGYQRNNRGDILIDPTNGLPLVNTVYSVFGDRNPDFRLGWNNVISYKNWRLSFLWDLKVGGDIFNGNNKFLTSIGKSPITADRYTPIVVEGVLRDGKENTATPTKNTYTIIPAYNWTYYAERMPEEVFIEKNVNWFRLRDLTVSYNFPQSIVRRIGVIKSLGAFFTVNDLILMTNYSGADPSVSGTSAGARGVGSAGFDYGTLPTPINVNFGIRLSL